MVETRFLLDSNICIYLLTGASPALTNRVAAQTAGSVFVSSISVAEVAIGYARRSADNGPLLTMFEHIEPLPFDRAAAFCYAHIPFKRANFDRLLAAHALSLDATIVTNNASDFADVAGLKLENWTL